MELVVDSQKMKAKRWGGFSESIEINFSEIEKVESFKIDESRKGIKIIQGKKQSLYWRYNSRLPGFFIYTPGKGIDILNMMRQEEELKEYQVVSVMKLSN